MDPSLSINANEQSALLNILGEMQDIIFEKLGGIERLILRQVCKRFQNIVPPLRAEELRDAEEEPLALKKDLYGCYTCLRLRRHTSFADATRKKKRRRYGPEWFKRFCIDCGLDDTNGPPKYLRGNALTIDGMRYGVCVVCKRFALASKPVGNELRPFCQPCAAPRLEQIEQDRRRADWRAYKEARARDRENKAGSHRVHRAPSDTESEVSEDLTWEQWLRRDHLPWDYLDENEDMRFYDAV
ncbi:hypothetical protein GGR57DRAFT_120536 [Xylariaceae sp. FL1272]|nr:hypothetical protein GGR57DRAFT_120536 [Xylariaceae sp. FL1272]